MTHKIGRRTAIVKNLMSKQYNKAEKRKRRLSYLKRKKTATKAARKKKQPEATPAA